MDLELACCVFYNSELMLRLWVHQSCFFYSSPYVGWSIFVFLLVVLAIQEQATKNDSNSSYLRTAQSLRILTELRLINGRIMASIKTLLWTVLLVTSVTFRLSIFFVRGMTDLPAVESGYVNWRRIEGSELLVVMSCTGGRASTGARRASRSWTRTSTALPTLDLRLPLGDPEHDNVPRRRVPLREAERLRGFCRQRPARAAGGVLGEDSEPLHAR